MVKKGPMVITTNSPFSQLFKNRSTQNNLKLAVLNNSSKRYMSADHGKLWTIEKALSAGLLAIVPAAILYPNQALDHLLALSLVVHAHW